MWSLVMSVFMRVRSKRRFYYNSKSFGTTTT